MRVDDPAMMSGGESEQMIHLDILPIEITVARGIELAEFVVAGGGCQVTVGGAAGKVLAIRGDRASELAEVIIAEEGRVECHSAHHVNFTINRSEKDQDLGSHTDPNLVARIICAVETAKGAEEGVY